MTADDRVRFDRIGYITSEPNDDVPLQRSCPTWYERWGDGRPAGQAEFEASRDFYDRLPGWLANLAGSAPSSFGAIRRLISGGFLVDKAGLHGQGRAMDVDEVTWASGVIRPKDGEHASSDPVRVLRYIGLDAICRRHFPVVFDGWHNAPHGDHIHAEGVGIPLLDKTARSATVFCQATCRIVFGADIPIDGRWGETTQAAMDDAQRRAGVAGDMGADAKAWSDWLYFVGRTSLRGETARAAGTAVTT